MSLQPPSTDTRPTGLAAPSETPDARRSRLVEELVEAMETLPANPTAAMQVMWLADGAKTDAAALAGAIELDPGLTARVLRLANSAYYSPYGSVSSVSRAVVNVGFSTIRALATSSLTGLDDAPELPVRFWEHAAVVAHACNQVARQFGVPGKTAFALGLLHDVGEGLLCTVDPSAWREIEASTSADNPDRLTAEIAAFGMHHAEVAGRVLDAWRLPADLVDAIRDHHRVASSVREPSGLSRVLEVAEAIACLHCEVPDATATALMRRRIENAGLSSDFVTRVGSKLSEETEALAGALSERG